MTPSNTGTAVSTKSLTLHHMTDTSELIGSFLQQGNGVMDRDDIGSSPFRILWYHHGGCQMPVPVHLDQSCRTPELPSIRMHVSPVVVVEQCFTVWRSVSRCNNCFISKRTFFLLTWRACSTSKCLCYQLHAPYSSSACLYSYKKYYFHLLVLCISV